MRAIVIHAARDLRIEEQAEESLGAGQVRLRLATGGVCGSDLHYYNHGGFGAVRLREPMVLGHEISAYVTDLGPGVTGFAPGQLVAVSPSRPCGACRYCAQGLQNHCLHMRFYGSAMPFPHIQGAFRETLVADASQCVDATGLTAGEAAMAEPLAVTLHATARAGGMLGKRVLVTGCGPIGVLSILAARRAGAAEIVATDLSDFTLALAGRVGADRVINTATTPDALAGYAADKGYFDVLYECTGVAAALAGGIAALRPRGVILQLGLGGDMTLPMMAITAKELDLRGSFRFHGEFGVGVGLMQKRLIDVRPLITQTVPLEQAETAFRLASDRSVAMKAQIVFSDEGSGGLYGTAFGQDGVQFGGVSVGPQFLHHTRITHGARHKGKRLEVVHARILGGEQRKDQIHRLAINAIIVQRLFQPQEHASDAGQILQPCVRQGDAMAHTGGAKAFAFLQAIKRTGCRQAIGLCGDVTQFMEQALFACQLADKTHGAGDQQFGKFHKALKSCPATQVYFALRGSIQPIFPSSRR